MAAIISDGRDHKRQILGKILPIRTPFTVFINPSTLCNFKCFYCTHGKPSDELDKINFRRANMSMDTYMQAIEQIKEFDDKLKLIYLFGNGEPLCNPLFPKMVYEAKRGDITEKLETFTNASLLTHDLSKDIIDAGLTKLKISIQGVSSERYKNIIGRDFDFDKMVEQIEFFYKNRKDCKVFIKIIDADLSDEDKNTFFSIFEKISDEINIEQITYMQRTMGDYDDVIKDKKNLWNEPLEDYDACPFPFYMIRVGVDGDIQPCFDTLFDKGKININEISLKQHWNSNHLRNFWLMHLKAEREKNSFCNNCLGGTACSLKEERIDSYRNEILSRMGEL